MCYSLIFLFLNTIKITIYGSIEIILKFNGKNEKIYSWWTLPLFHKPVILIDKKYGIEETN